MTTDDERDAEHLALGRLVAAGRTLERVGYLIARAVGALEPEAKNISPALKGARILAREEMPPWSRVDVSELETWIENVLTILDHRNRYVHWQRYQRAEDGGWVDYHRSARGPGQDQRFSVTDLEKWTERARAASERGHEVLFGLLFQVREGVYHWHPALARPGEEWSPYAVVSKDGVWPKRPADDEMAEWYERLRRESPPEWGDWPAKRHAQQLAK